MASFNQALQNRNHNEKEWHVDLYRKTLTGFEKMTPKTSSGRHVLVKVAPRNGCIVVRQLHIRIRLTAGNSSKNRNNDGINDGGSSKGDGGKEEERFISVKRRRETIVITSNQRIRVLILKFRTQKDCIDFSDRLVELNPPQVLNQHERSLVGGATAPRTNAGNSISRRETVGNGSIENITNNSNSNNNTREVLSFIARLLNDGDFVDYIDAIEKHLLFSEDGSKMLQALVDPENKLPTL